MSIATATSSVTKGETLIDTVKNLEAMAPDMIVMRHASSGAPHLLSRICRSAIINAGDGTHEHPTQALLDAFTIREHKGRLAGFEGRDRRRSASQPRPPIERAAAEHDGCGGLACGPATLMPAGVEQLGAAGRRRWWRRRSRDADVVMMLRIQHERMHGHFFPSVREYFALFNLVPPYSSSGADAWPGRRVRDLDPALVARPPALAARFGEG